MLTPVQEEEDEQCIDISIKSSFHVLGKGLDSSIVSSIPISNSNSQSRIEELSLADKFRGGEEVPPSTKKSEVSEIQAGIRAYK